jgi:feruloyl-CoA synthase
VLLDWLPWSHTFGGNHNLNMVLRHGGTLYIDDGRPLPGLVEKTLAQPARGAAHVYFNVPRGFEMLLPALEADEALARRFFGRLRMLFYAGAAHAAGHLGAPGGAGRGACAARSRCGSPPAWGSTETSAGRHQRALAGSTAPASSACRCRAWS